MIRMLLVMLLTVCMVLSAGCKKNSPSADKASKQSQNVQKDIAGEQDGSMDNGGSGQESNLGGQSSGQNESQGDGQGISQQGDTDDKGSAGRFKTPVVTSYEENGVRYIKESGALIDVIYPMHENTFANETFAKWSQINVSLSTSNVDREKSAYILIAHIRWPEEDTIQGIESFEYTTYNGKCTFHKSNNPFNVKNSQFIMEPLKVSAEESRKLVLDVVLEIPASDYAWNNYRQKTTVEKGLVSDALINVIIKVKVTYKDGIEKTDYYKVKANIQGMESMEFYKLE